MSVEDIQNLYKLINNLSVEVSGFIASTTSEHSHLSETVDKHIEKDEEWKESMDAQLSAIAQSLLQKHARDEGQAEMKTKISEFWKWGIVIVATLIAGNLPEVFDKLSLIFK